MRNKRIHRICWERLIHRGCGAIGIYILKTKSSLHLYGPYPVSICMCGCVDGPNEVRDNVVKRVGVPTQGQRNP